MYIGINDQAKKVSNAYIGINGQAKQISKIYVGVNGQAKLAWEYNIQQPTDWNDDRAQVFYKPKDLNSLSFTAPENNWYRLELISPFTRDYYGYYQNNLIIGGQLELNFTKDNNIIRENLYNVETYNTTLDAKNKEVKISLINAKGVPLGCGSSYGCQYIRLRKGEKINLQWTDNGINSENLKFSKGLKITTDKNTNIIEFYSTANNIHTFINASEEDIAQPTTGPSISTELLFETSNGKFINIPKTFEGTDFTNINNVETNYTLYNQDQVLTNAKKCNELGLGAFQSQSAIGNSSIYISFDFNSNFSKANLSIGASDSLVNDYLGCFRITPALIK